MKARAPGKLVLSGAYAVLRGAPALVTAVDRFVIADTAEPAGFETAEVAAALELLGAVELRHPAFDASQLREHERKLGLGSSAAILVASLLALLQPVDAAARTEVYQLCRSAHRRAQGGGSGVDVAASFFGGTLAAQKAGDDLVLDPVTLPPGLVFEVWSMTESAKTSDFVARLFAREHETDFSRHFGAQLSASAEALGAARRSDGAAFVAALRAQWAALDALGTLAGVPIVVPALRTLHGQLAETACFLPAGAGGGDVSVYVGESASPARFREQATASGLRRLELTLGASGASLLG